MTLTAQARWSGALVLATLALAGCSSVSRGSLEAVRLAVHGESVHPTAASVASTPYYQMQADGPDGGAVLILASTDGGRLGWYGSGKDIVLTRDGLVVKTVGLSQDLESSTFIGDDPFHAGLQKLASPRDAQRRLDWSPGYRYGLVAHSHLEPRGIEQVDILGTVHALRRVDETLTVTDAGTTLHNRYWIDPADGFIWKSRQYVAPGLPLELTQLRPYRVATP
ncbi:YjbF family lipoprotein [Luteibacter sp. 3190]|uniref:YjbF family lipoprotein n=1 Tax=Luteibacter sp. 3190 TaxID=2817736 RepID=UPI00285621DF|nr:YjbF family lipoprotein [Luteibacter sp. 3190]MDR6935632.1 hypothetical protein [Luteibacter sp. 3190]